MAKNQINVPIKSSPPRSRGIFLQMTKSATATDYTDELRLRGTKIIRENLCHLFGPISIVAAPQIKNNALIFIPNSWF